MAFATYQDVEARWRTLTAEEQARANVLLEDASNMLISMVTIDVSDQQQAKNLKQVCANMVIRSMVASASETYGVDELHATMGPFGQTAKFANPNGDLYVTKQERKLLGIRGGKGRILRPAIGGDLIAQLPNAL